MAEQISRREKRNALKAQRYRRRLTIFFAGLAVSIIVLVVALAVAFGPWKLSSGMKKTTGKPASRLHKPVREVGQQASSIPGKDGQSAPKETRVQKKSDPTPPAIAIVIDDVGNSNEKLPVWLGIDAPLNFSVMPYPPLSTQLAEILYQAGYQVMMHIPTQNQPPNSFAGAGQLATGMSQQTVFATLDNDASSIPHVVGINNHQGGLGCNDAQLMTLECEWAKQHGLFVFDSKSSTNSKVAQSAVQLGMSKKINQVFIDHQNDPEYIRSAMRQLAGYAKQNGYSMGICHWHRPNTATVVGEMINTLKAEGIHFAFASQVNN